MAKKSTAQNEPKETKLYLVGAGVCFPEHLTVQTIDTLSACRYICTNLPDELLVSLPADLRAKCKSLWPLYQDGRERSANYKDVAQAVLDAAEQGGPVAWMTPGHPIIFDSVSQLLLQSGRARGWQVSVLPAISSLDTILAEVGYDPANGLFIQEATCLVRQRIPLQPMITTILLQPSHFGTNNANIQNCQPNLTPLRDYLLEFYAPEQECGFVRSSSKITEGAVILWTKLRDLTGMTFEALGNCSMLIPAATIVLRNDVRRPAQRGISASKVPRSSKSPAKRHVPTV